MHCIIRHRVVSRAICNVSTERDAHIGSYNITTNFFILSQQLQILLSALLNILYTCTSEREGGGEIY